MQQRIRSRRSSREPQRAHTLASSAGGFARVPGGLDYVSQFCTGARVTQSPSSFQRGGAAGSRCSVASRGAPCRASRRPASGSRCPLHHIHFLLWGRSQCYVQGRTAGTPVLGPIAVPRAGRAAQPLAAGAPIEAGPQGRWGQSRYPMQDEPPGLGQQVPISLQTPSSSQAGQGFGITSCRARAPAMVVVARCSRSPLASGCQMPGYTLRWLAAGSGQPAACNLQRAGAARSLTLAACRLQSATLGLQLALAARSVQPAGHGLQRAACSLLL